MAVDHLIDRQALKNVVRYHRVLTEGVQLSFETDQHYAVLAAIPADRSAMVGRQAVEFGTSALVRMCRGLTAQKLRPLWVQFDLPLPRAKARYAAVLKAPVYFEQPQIAVVFSNEVLAVPVKRADHRLLRILETHCCEILGQGDESDTVSDVRQVLTRLLSGGVPRLEQTAAELNTSVRTLERRLKERGWTYKQVVDDLRRQLALRYVKDPRLRLSQLGSRRCAPWTSAGSDCRSAKRLSLNDLKRHGAERLILWLAIGCFSSRNDKSSPARVGSIEAQRKECLERVSFPPPVSPVETFFLLRSAPAGTPQNAGLRCHLSEPR